MLATLLDRVLYRHAFEGKSAQRYATAERPAFGDLDERLLDHLDLAGVRRLLDVGCGPGTFAVRAAERHPDVTVIAIDPGTVLTSLTSGPQGREITGRPRDGFNLVAARAAGEALPIADGTIDLAICLSSIRHVQDRPRVLRELRRVVRPGGRLVIVELDPTADARRIANHADHLGSWWLRAAFGPLVVRTSPRAETIEALARDAGWQRRALRNDPVQPVYILELA